MSSIDDLEESEGQSSPLRWFDSISLKNLVEVGGKNASIGVLSALLAADGGSVLAGFALAAHAYRSGLMRRGLATVASLRLQFLPSLICVKSDSPLLRDALRPFWQ